MLRIIKDKNALIIKLVIFTVLNSLLLVFPVSNAGVVSAASVDNENIEDSKNALVLTLDEAINRAIANNTDLKLAEYDIERNEKMREKAAEKVKYTPLDGSNEEASSAFTSLVQSDLTWQMSKKTLESKRDTVTEDVYKFYTDVLLAQEKVKTTEKALVYADFQRRAARMGYQVGKVSQDSKVTAEANYSAKEAALVESQANLAESYRKLNDFIGLNLEERPVLVDDFIFEPFQVDSLDYEIAYQLETSPDLWQTEKEVEKARLDLDLFSWNSGTPYDVKKIDLAKKQISAADSKNNLEQSLRTDYYSICQLEQQYRNQERELSLAENDLQNIELKHKLGLVSIGEVLAAELEVANRQESLKSLTYQHALAKRSFLKK